MTETIWPFMLPPMTQKAKSQKTNAQENARPKSLAPEIYLDNAATTAPDPEVVELIRQTMLQDWGNAGAGHKRGAHAAHLVGEARKSLSHIFASRPDDVIFCSGGSEANALALMGAARARRGHKIIISAIEHSSIRKSAEIMVEQGFELLQLPVNEQAQVNLELLDQAVDDDTAVVAIMHANNEVGSIQAISEAAKIVHKNNPRCHFHVDTVQSFGKEAVNLKILAADSLAISAHKFHGPQGIGALILARDKPLKAISAGGGQERGLRPGTENLPGIVGMAKAAQLVHKHRSERKAQMEQLRQRLADGLLARNIDISISGDPNAHLCNILHLRVPGLNSQHLLHSLEAQHLLASAGSACHQGQRGPSATLRAMGFRQADFAPLRLSLSALTTAEQIDKSIDIISKTIHDLRALGL